jgi:hypothetical protein
MHVMHQFLTRACAVAAVGVALGMWGVTAASASSGGRATIHHGARGPAGIAAGGSGALRLTHNDHAIGRSANAPTNNRTFAGYQATVRAGSATVAAASFALPTLSCTTADRAITPSAAVVVRNNISASFVFTGCVSGTASYFPGLVVNGTETDFTTTPFAAGDVIDVTTKVSTNRTRVQVTDVTTGVTQKIIGSGARAQAVLIGDSGWAPSAGHLQHVPDFGQMTFKNCLVDGHALGSVHPRAVQRVNSHGTVQIATGGFFPGGTAFSTHFMHS